MSDYMLGFREGVKAGLLIALASALIAAIGVVFFYVVLA